MKLQPSGVGILRGCGKPARQRVHEVSRSAVRDVRENSPFEVLVERARGHAFVIRVRGHHEDCRPEYILYRLPRVPGKGRLYEFYCVPTWHIFLPSPRRTRRILPPPAEGSCDAALYPSPQG